MSERWHRDPKTGEHYQERKEKDGTIVRYYAVEKESSRNRGEASSSRRDQTSRRTRRNSIVSSDSIDTKTASRYQSVATSSKREPSGRAEDDRRRTGRNEARYRDDNRGYGRQGEPSGSYGETQVYSSYREGETPYHPAGGYNPQGNAASTVGNPVDNLTRGMQDLSTGNTYTDQPIASSLPASLGYAEQTSYDTLNPTHADYGQSITAQPTLRSKATDPSSRVVKGTPGSSERLDPSYKVRNHDYKQFFKVGRVFATLWTEGVGNDVNSLDQTFVSEVAFKERVYSKVRRFVVVRENNRSVTCLPVTSYGGHGPGKRGIDLQEHGFIYSKSPPKKVEKMLSRPLRVILSRTGKDLEDPSLVNYRKVYTVETNVKVKDVGQLDADSKVVLERYFKRVFNGEGDISSGIDDALQQGTAVLAHVGGAAYDLVSPPGYNTAPVASGYPPLSPYSPATGQNVAVGYPPSTYAAQAPTGYATTAENRTTMYDSSAYYNTTTATGYTAGSDMRMSRAGEESHYPSQPGTGVAAADTGSSYPSVPGYGPVATAGAAYNTTPTYYSPSTYPSSDSRYNTDPVNSDQYGYGAAYQASQTPRSYPPGNATSGDHYTQTGRWNQATAGGSDPYYTSHQTNDISQPPRRASTIDDGGDDISLPTYEEESRHRHNSNAGTRSDRERRRPRH